MSSYKQKLTNTYSISKVVKWKDDSPSGTPVTLRIHPSGFFLYWVDQYNETEFLEISSIRDTRTGRYARIPRDGKLKESINIGPADITLEDKTLTIAYGPDFVNINFINFVCNSKEDAQLWTDQLLEMAYNPLALNSSFNTLLAKAHSKIQLMTDKDGKILSKNIVKIFARHPDDKKRVEKALEESGLPCSKNYSISPDKFTFEVFFTFYKNLVVRAEIDEIFDKLISQTSKSQKEGPKLMTLDRFVDFLNKEQRDPRLNEILYLYADRVKGREIINQYEPNKSYAEKDLLSVDGFLRYLMSDHNLILAPEKFDQNQDMDQPLNHYFINSSHNTYLTGHQLAGKSSVEIYRQCLLAGCRCVELDCWNGNEEPVITHGFTAVTSVGFKEVLEAIAESAFKTSNYPVLLSFENHCSKKQQAKIAMYCRKIFGDMLLTEPLPDYPLKAGVKLPSPKALFKKIIIKNKKQHYVRRERRVKNSLTVGQITTQADKENTATDQLGHLSCNIPSNVERRSTPNAVNKDDNENEKTDRNLVESEDSSHATSATKDINLNAGSCDLEELDSESSSEDDEAPPSSEATSGDIIDVHFGESLKESKAGAEMSALVNYIQSVTFHSFEHAERRNRSYEISSFAENQATSLLKEWPVDFVNLNKRQLSRIYPKGTRTDSRNYMPQVYWNAGCQMVALNFQTLDLGMQLNLGIFDINGRSGYILKPDFMRRTDRRFDPFTESTVDGIIAGTVAVKIISGQFLSDKRTGTYVEVDMFGLPADAVRRKWRTKIVPTNGINPIYDDEPFVFKKVVLPELASLRIAAYEENGKLVGHRILPVVGLRPGYRHLSLRNESGQPLTLPTLFVHITVKDYVPDGLSDFADALANPIAYQSMIEKRSKQLMALTDEEENDSEVSNLDSKVASAIDIAHRKGSQMNDEKRPSGICQKDSIPSLFLNVSSVGSIKVNDPINGIVQKPQGFSSCSSPAHPNSRPLLRQDTYSIRLNQSARSLSDEAGNEKLLSLLESTEANLTTESLIKLKENNKVRKVISKMEKEMQALKKKHEKIRDKEIYVIKQKEDKLILSQEKSKKDAKLGKKSLSIESQGASCSSTQPLTKVSKRRQSLQLFVSSVSSLNRYAIKRRSEIDIQDSLADMQTKLEELHLYHAHFLLNMIKEHYKAEKQLYNKYHELFYSALEKVMRTSQNAQLQFLEGLHEQDVSSLQKKIEAQTKEDLMSLSKMYKDKNELSRIKREAQQKVIDQAVIERQRLASLLKKRKAELESKHEEIRLKFEEEKQKEMEESNKELEAKIEQLNKDFEANPSSFVANFIASSSNPATKN